eukprot:11197101-Lingulodinium_polyedra.AAC.1
MGPSRSQTTEHWQPCRAQLALKSRSIVTDDTIAARALLTAGPSPGHAGVAHVQYRPSRGQQEPSNSI